MNKYQHLIDHYSKLAEIGHEGQFRSDGKKYFTHVEAVANLVQKQQDFIDYAIEDDIKAGIIILSKLHDIKEGAEDYFNSVVFPDMQVKMQENFDYYFLNTVYQGVKAISKKEKGTEDYTDYLLRVKNHEWARMVKIADLTHNMSDLKPGNLKDKYSISKYFLEH